METCLSGLRYIFAKDAGFNRPREFESRRLRDYKNERPRAPFLFVETRECPAALLCEIRKTFRYRRRVLATEIEKYLATW